jgi:2'-5' RNA ligase
MYRLFIAIDLPDLVKDAIANICFGVPGAKWVPKDQSHLTVRFIGEVEDYYYSHIVEGLKSVTASRLDLSLKGVGYFPPRNKPRVLWVGMEKNEGMIDLRDAIEKELKEIGLAPEERKFSPHITLARLGLQTPLGKVTEFLSANSLFKIDSIPVDEFNLYSSILTPSGAVHRLETTYTLL